MFKKRKKLCFLDILQSEVTYADHLAHLSPDRTKSVATPAVKCLFKIIIKEFPSSVQYTTGMLSYDLPIVNKCTRTINQNSSYKQVIDTNPATCRHPLYSDLERGTPGPGRHVCDIKHLNREQ